MSTFTIYADLAQEVSKRLDRLAKKAADFSIPFSYTISDERPQAVKVRKVDPVGNTVYTVSTYTTAVVDVNVECDGLIQANGWTIRAKVEHGKDGNIVTAFGDAPVDQRWYTAPANCDHCKTNRFRSVTFFCENEAGEIRQVGRTCLKDYTGISPATAAMWAEVRDLLDDSLDLTTDEWEDRRLPQMYEVAAILAHAHDLIEEFGYRKSDEPSSTKEQVKDRLLSGDEPSSDGMAKAKVYIEWLSGLGEIAKEEDRLRDEAWEEAENNATAVRWTPNTVGDVERNCIPLALSGYAKLSHVGRLAYIPVAYRRYQERMKREVEKEAARKASADVSVYVGAIGERLSVKIASAQLVTSWDGMYGTTWLYKFTDESGNVFVWYASRPCKAEGGSTIKATVKDHKERDGVKQTIITRCQEVAA